MKVIVSGCGKIGTAIIESLLKEKHEIVAIDIDSAVIENVTNSYDVLAICGNGTSFEVLKEAGADTTDLFISVTAKDEFNMLSCFVAKQMGAKNTASRIRNSEYNDPSFDFVKQRLGINLIINPELLTAQTLYNILKFPSATKIEHFTASESEMIELTLKDGLPILNVPLYELRKQFPYNFLVCVVQRDDKTYIPNGFFTLQAGDKVGIFASKAHSHKLIKAFGIEQKPIKSIMIVGASKVAHYLSKLLLTAKNDVKIIDKNEEKCKEFSEKLESATIIHGDGMSQDLLLEEGITSTDSFVALTGKDEENVLMSIYSKSKNVPKTITKINRDEIIDISEDLGLETVVTAKYLVADVLVKYARALESSKESKIETLYSLFSGQAEAAEFVVFDGFKQAGVPLKELKLESDMLIAGIIRNGNTVIPGGDDVIMVGDRVIVITAGHSLYELGDVLRK